MFDILFKNRSAEDYGLFIKARPSVPAPEISRLEYVIPGRDGVLNSAFSRYEPIDISIDFNFMTSEDSTGVSYRRAKAWLNGSGELIFSDDSEVFYKVYGVKISGVTRSSYKIVSFTATFRCDPYTYIKTGAVELTPTECQLNEYEVCHPLYHITGSGAWTLSVNGNVFTGTGETFVDSDRMIAYDSSNNLKNTSVFGDYSKLYLRNGLNSITCTNPVKLKPFWRCL